MLSRATIAASLSKSANAACHELVQIGSPAGACRGDVVANKPRHRSAEMCGILGDGRSGGALI